MAVGEIVEQIVRVHHGNIPQSERGHTLLEVNLHCIARGGNDPEETVCGDPRAVVMGLYQRVSHAYRTGGVDVESYEDERTMVVSSVLPDIFALHCSHVSAKRDWCAQSGAGA